MKRYEDAVGAGEAPTGATGGRGAGAGRLTADAAAVVAGTARGAAELLADRLAAADRQTADDLFTAAFGLYGARHLGGALPDGPRAGAELSWWHGPTVHHPAGLRAREGARRGRVVEPRRGSPAVSGRGGRHRKPEQAPGSTPQEIAVERRTAARLLAAQPLVTAAGPHGAGFPLIRRHADWLAERFATVLGYPLTVGAGFARLHKAPLPGRALAPADGGTAWTPAAYSALVLALAALAEGRPAGLDAPGVRQQLADWQVLTPGGTVDRVLAGALAPLPAPAPAGPALTVRRRLAETPVLLLDELAPEERRWLEAGLDREAGLFADFLGLEAEIRAEGVALLDPADELTDLALPGTGTLAQAALLLAARLVEELRPLPDEAAPPAVLIPDALIDGALGDVTDEYGLRSGWRRDYLADLTAFRRDALDLLHRMQLIAPAGRAWLLRAPAARYAPAAEPPPPGSGRHSRPLVVG
ncbi:DUF2398 family protein [Kitasatospora sp. NPDC002040]|uniref:DUF2398 family protein n=1 Tax=Kitasatospora sp. NPDC002040 TaxID=3154661 RepID=UPI003327F48D